MSNPEHKPALRRIINAAGPVTPLGAGTASETVIEAMADAMRRSFDMGELQAVASTVIEEAFNASAGCIVGCTAAGITLAVAGTMTGIDLARVEQLPDTSGMKCSVALLRGHDCWFGAQVGQMIRLAGARVKHVGTPERATEAELASALGDDTTAAVYVASHHTAQAGMIPLHAFVDTCGRAGVPVIVDAAGTVDPATYLAAGAAIVLASAQKNFGGPTAGIVAGRRDLVEACLLQERGIGRPMKAGKEGIAGAIAGLHEWMACSRPGREAAWCARAEQLCASLAGVTGLSAELETDPPEHRIPRARVRVDATACGFTARDIASRLREHEPAIRVWEAGLPDGYFALDTRCLDQAELPVVSEAIRHLVLSRHKPRQP